MILARHYKGGVYEVMATGRAEATREPKVYYRPVTNHSAHGWYDRPLADFIGFTEVNGKPVKRFTITDSDTGQEVTVSPVI